MEHKHKNTLQQVTACTTKFHPSWTLEHTYDGNQTQEVTQHYRSSMVLGSVNEIFLSNCVHALCQDSSISICELIGLLFKVTAWLIEHHTGPQVLPPAAVQVHLGHSGGIFSSQLC